MSSRDRPAAAERRAYRPGEVDEPDLGYVFCPEHRTGSAEPLYGEGGSERRPAVGLFGPAMLPDEDVPVGKRAGIECRLQARRVPPPAPERDDGTPQAASSVARPTGEMAEAIATDLRLPRAPIASTLPGPSQNCRHHGNACRCRTADEH